MTLNLVRFGSDDYESIIAFLENSGADWRLEGDSIILNDSERVSPGEWIVRGSDGEVGKW